MSQPIDILGYGYVAPYARLADVATGAEIELPKLDLGLLERTLRRGLSEVTRLFMHAAKLALDDAATPPARVHVIFASAFGEIATAEALLAEAYDANGSSPARFRHSVHNTAAGLLSISTKNRLSCTAVAAGWETVAMALCEASAQLATEADQVLLVFAEERVPVALSHEHRHAPLAVSFVLSRPTSAPRRGRLEHLRRAAQRPPATIFDALDHPLGPALAIAHALEERRAATIAVGDGEMPWCIDVHGWTR